MTIYDSTYCTLTSVQNRWAIDGAQAADAVQLTKNIWDASASITAFCQRWFVPFTDTRLYDYTLWRCLMLDTDLLALTSIADASGVRSASDYVVTPYNRSPKEQICLTDTAQSWLFTINRQQAITVIGTWGYNQNPATMWRPTDGGK
jgi:hypothetical protein